MLSLKQQTVSGIKWTFVGSMAQRAISFVTMVILARLLDPKDFGLYALAFVMIDAFGLFKSLGFDSALVRRKDEDIAKAYNTAFFLIPAMGMILFVILFLIAPFAAQFLGNPAVGNVIRALAVIFVLHCFSKVPQTILYREMKFKYRTIAELSGNIVNSVLAITLAFKGFGVWSLVIAYIFKASIQGIMEWVFSGWRPRFEFDKAIAWNMFHFGKYVLASGIVWFLYNNLDNIVIGKLIGVTMLGYYAISKNAANFLSDYFLGRVGFIMYPAYSKIQEDINDVKRIMLRTLRYVSIIAFPFAFFLFLFASDILRTVFGEKWLPAAGILQILSFVGLLNALSTVIWPAFLAKGQSKIDFQIGLAQVVLFFVLVVPLILKFKLTGLGAAVLISAVVSFGIGLIRIRRLIGVKLYEIMIFIKPGLLSSIFMLSASIFLKSMSKIENATHNFFILMIIATSLYLLSILIINKNILKEVKEILILN